MTQKAIELSDGVGDVYHSVNTVNSEPIGGKRGENNASMCHVVEDSGLCFSPVQIDEKLNTLTAVTPLSET